MRRFRRRIILIGALLAAAVAAVGAPMYLRAIEQDLERRVPAELAGSGIDGVRAAFSGQEGVLHCQSPLADPEQTLDRAHEISGVVLVELDRSCRVSSAPLVVATEVEDPVEARSDPPDPTSSDDSSGTVAVPGFGSVGELLGTAPRLSLFAILVEESGLTEELTAPGTSVTVFAPVDAAFDELPADVIAELRTRPDLLAEMVRNHLVDGVIEIADLRRSVAEGVAEITTRARDTLPVTFDGGAPFVGEAEVVEGDLLAGNGVVHAIDRLLLPADLELRALHGLPELVAVLRSGAIELSGSVPTDVDRIRLIAAATRALAATNIDHDLTVDPDIGLSSETVGALVEVIELLPRVLVTGSAGYDGSVFARGIAVDAAGRDELTAAAGPDAAIELALRPEATAEDLDALQVELAEVLAERPVQFAPGTAEPTDDGPATLDLLASIAKRYDGVLIVVEGHTDTAGDPQRNLELSELRAAVVLLELVIRGVPADQLDLVGLGSADPIIVDGVEDRGASRRVELVVRPADPTP